MNAKSFFKYFPYFSWNLLKIVTFRESTEKRVYNEKLQSQPFKKEAPRYCFTRMQFQCLIACVVEILHVGKARIFCAR